MNNEFLKITIITLSQVDVSKKIQNEHRCVSVTVHRCICMLQHTGAFVCHNASVCFYDLWARQKYQNQLKISVCLCDTTHQCFYVRLRTSAFVRRMGNTQIPIPIINLSAFVCNFSPMHLCETTH